MLYWGKRHQEEEKINDVEEEEKLDDIMEVERQESAT